MKLSLDIIGYGGHFTAPDYGLPSFESRSRRASRGEDWLEAWHQGQRGIRGHQLGTIKLVDERYAASLAFLKGLLLKLGAYTGRKKSPS